MRNALSATALMPPPLMVALVTHWIRTGIAGAIILAIRNEAAGRQRLAAKFLKGFRTLLERTAIIFGCLCRDAEIVRNS
jgi:DNA-binding transcriptional MocR family regulator